MRIPAIPPRFLHHRHWSEYMPPRVPHLRGLALAVTLFASSLGASACTQGTNDTPAAGDCERTRAHVIDLQIERETKPGNQLRNAELAKHKLLRLAANRSSAIARCQSDMSASDVTCALGAATLDAYRACGRR